MVGWPRSCGDRFHGALFRACPAQRQGNLLPDLLRRVAALTLVSALGIALLAPLAVESAPLPRGDTRDSLLDAGAAVSALDRGSDGRERLAALTLLDRQRPIGAESLTHAARALPTPASVQMQPMLVSAATPLPTPVPPEPAPAVATAPPPPPPPTPVSGNSVSGLATWYCCSAGWTGEAVVALPGALGGHYDAPPAARSVTICADRCATLPVADYCGCLWGTADQKVADLSPEAWAAISDADTSAGVIRVTVHLD